MAFIEQVRAIEVLDSRGRPTVKATVRLAGGAVGCASVPSGASTGSAEAVELRDNDPKRYGDLGCRRAVENVNSEIAGALVGQAIDGQVQLDRTMIDLDGTPSKARLGANAILVVSIAFARACAVASRTPLYEHFARLVGRQANSLPRLTVNLFSGGKHAGGQVEFQDILVVPTAATSIDDGLAVVDAVYRAAERLIASKYGMRSLKADEGGLAPPFKSVEDMLADARQAIELGGYELGREVALAVDVASTHFHRDGRYHIGSAALSSDQMIERLAKWVDEFKIVSLEDGLSEEDWNHWPSLRLRLSGRALTLGDDFLCTNPQRIQRAIKSNAADALLLKVNQIGTLTEAAEALNLAKSADWRVTISARSGETEDDWLADLAVGWGGDQIKVGSIRQSERLAKYNRLLEIEQATRFAVTEWPRQPT
ncbi:MAG TPA: phosphopyruvate hydratase [Tepidisphaeraceae bacterium]